MRSSIWRRRHDDTSAQIGSAFGALSTADDVLSGIDLSDLGSVRVFAERFLASGRTVDIVINSAGAMACPETRVGPGREVQFATNHLGHYALINHLRPALASGGARVMPCPAAPTACDGTTSSSNAAVTPVSGRSRCTRAAFSRRCGVTWRRRRWSTRAGSTRTATGRPLWAAASPLLAGLGGVYCEETAT